MSKIMFYDLETTGTKFWKNGIHQISGMIEIDGKAVEEFNFHIKPNPKAEIEKEALEVGGVTMEQIMSYPEMDVVYRQFVAMLNKYVNKYDKADKMILAGYNNAPFDNQFLRAFFVQNGDKYFGSYFWPNSIDVMVLATLRLLGVRSTMENFKLMTVAKTVGVQIDESKLHDAMYDIYLTREIYNRIIAEWNLEKQ